jgi:hypothetical protein
MVPLETSLGLPYNFFLGKIGMEPLGSSHITHVFLGSECGAEEPSWLNTMVVQEAL